MPSHPLWLTPSNWVSLRLGNEKCARTFLAQTFWTPPGSGTSQIPLFKTQGRQTFEGGHELFGHHPFAWKTPIPPGGLRTQKLNLCALFLGWTISDTQQWRPLCPPPWQSRSCLEAPPTRGPESAHSAALLPSQSHNCLWAPSEQCWARNPWQPIPP